MQLLKRTNGVPMRYIELDLYDALVEAEIYLQEIDLFATKYVRPYNGMHTSYSVKAYTDSGVYESSKQDLHDLRQVLDPIIAKLCAWYESEYRGKFRCVYADVSTLKSGDIIDWHVDNYVFHSLAHRVHIPIHTSPEVEMRWFDSGRVIKKHLERYNAVEIDNLMFHSVENNSSKPRTHLMFDIMNEKVYNEYKKANPVGFKKIVSTVVNDHFHSKRADNV